MMNENDLRIRKTRTAIKKAFLELLNEKPLHSISVKEISEKAQCNRNTFYLHYIDKYDLIEKLCDAQLAVLKQELYETQNLQYASADQRYADIASRCLDCIERDLFFYEVMLKQNMNLDFAYRMRNILVAFITDSIVETEQKRKLLEVEFSASGMVGVIRYWLFHQKDYSKEDIQAELQYFISQLGGLLFMSRP